MLHRILQGETLKKSGLDLADNPVFTGRMGRANIFYYL